ncbi:hypothetical protein [Actinomyces sp. oral taxon 897]|uniref:hypothetical protein n=1 Tax=Actinomyces sp. oral taxon 897 TaxID=2081702 RepID=UPI00157FA61F|nr:hypothetical protein [Actinomyces sp. oral taxon 897]
MTDLPVPCWAGLYSAQLLLALLLAVLRLERAPRHDTLRRVRGTAVLVAVLPVPGPGLLLGATALAALTLLRRRANDDARAARSRLTASPLRPGGYPGSGLPDPDLLAGRVPDLPALPDPQALVTLPDPDLLAPPALADPADRGSTLPVLPATGPGPNPLGLPVLLGPGGGLPIPGLPAEHVLSAPTPGDRV